MQPDNVELQELEEKAEVDSHVKDDYLKAGDSNDLDVIPDNKHEKELEDLRRLDQSHCQVRRQAFVFAIFWLVFLSSLLRGSKKNESIIGIDRCSTGDFVILALLIVLILGVTILSVRNVKEEALIKARIGFPRVPSDIDWAGKTTVKLVILGFAGGCLSSLFGLGGSVIYNPIMLGLGVAPQVASATGMYMVMFTTLSSSKLFIVAGKLNIGYAFWLGTFVLFATYFGLNKLNDVIKKSGR